MDSDLAKPNVTDDTASDKKIVFDSNELLKRLDGDKELFNELLDIFLRDIPLRLERLKHALGGNDTRLATQQAHTVKGASANIGANAMRDAAFEIEMAARDNRLDMALSLVRRLKQEFEKFRSFLTDIALLGKTKQRDEV